MEEETGRDEEVSKGEPASLEDQISLLVSFLSKGSPLFYRKEERLVGSKLLPLKEQDTSLGQYPNPPLTLVLDYSCL